MTIAEGCDVEPLALVWNFSFMNVLFSSSQLGIQ